jgi:hypothetical protein
MIHLLKGMILVSAIISGLSILVAYGAFNLALDEIKQNLISLKKLFIIPRTIKFFV